MQAREKSGKCWENLREEGKGRELRGEWNTKPKNPGEREFWGELNPNQ